MNKYEVKIKFNAYEDKREVTFIVEAEDVESACYKAPNVEAFKQGYDVFAYKVLEVREV